MGYTSVCASALVHRVRIRLCGVLCLPQTWKILHPHAEAGAGTPMCLIHRSLTLCAMYTYIVYCCGEGLGSPGGPWRVGGEASGEMHKYLWCRCLWGRGGARVGAQRTQCFGALGAVVAHMFCARGRQRGCVWEFTPARVHNVKKQKNIGHFGAPHTHLHTTTDTNTRAHRCANTRRVYQDTQTPAGTPEPSCWRHNSHTHNTHSQTL
jgi:hypothetical protein